MGQDYCPDPTCFLFDGPDQLWDRAGRVVHLAALPGRAGRVLERRPLRLRGVRALLGCRRLVGGRGLWRIGRLDVEDYIKQAYQRTAERVAAGENTDDGERDSQRSRGGVGATRPPQPL